MLFAIHVVAAEQKIKEVYRPVAHVVVAGQVRRVTNTFLGQMQTVTTCPTCNGEGTTITAKCVACKGEGRVYGEETVTIEIPPGVQEGMQLNLSGKGNAGERGGAPVT